MGIKEKSWYTHQNEYRKCYLRYRRWAHNVQPDTMWSTAPSPAILIKGAFLNGCAWENLMEKIHCFHLFRLNAVRKHTGFCNLFHSDVCVCSLGVTAFLVGEKAGGWGRGRGSEYFAIPIPTFAALGTYSHLLKKKKKGDSCFNMHKNPFFAVFRNFGTVPTQYTKPFSNKF